jgi:hypothetical protein
MIIEDRLGGWPVINRLLGDQYLRGTNLSGSTCQRYRHKRRLPRIVRAYRCVEFVSKIRI